MDILEELKRLGNQDNGNKALTPIDLLEKQRSKMADTMMDIHAYLRELVGGLNQMNREINAEFSIPEVGTIHNLSQEDYELTFQNNANTDIITFSFSMVPRDKATFKIPADINPVVLDSLNRAGIGFNYQSNKHEIEIDDDIPVKLVFSSHPAEQYILLTIHNYDHPGRHRYALTTQMLDDYFKNQLGYYILRRDNNLILQLQDFLKTSTDSIPQLEGDITETDMNTTEMDVSRLKSLFSKEALIYLTYQNTIKEVSPKNNTFILGRSRQCDLKINSDLASRQHAQIVYRKGKFVLVDKSTNGSFVKPQGGKEVYVQGEEYPLSGSGFISLGKSVTVDNEHVIYYSCQ
ncbi:MAG: FHA domain-containing protein [Gammaproteobacteria bacterium]|nr:FHA domain-containing protein [Gammaproteobacteria bacterium]MDH5650916.1 FHA domain-containing protein [Gammaproteobacteria bacterium]